MRAAGKLVERTGCLALRLLNKHGLCEIVDPQRSSPAVSPFAGSPQ